MRTKIKLIIFDLDGTLVDSRPAIVASLHHAQRQFGMEIDSADELLWALGPPLAEIMARLLRTDDEARIARGIAAYRAHYASVCLTHAQPYSGIRRALTDLARTSTLFVGTSKLESIAVTVLDHFNLTASFARVCGSQADGQFAKKADVINEVIRGGDLDRSRTVIVGDREHDIAGARSCGLQSVAVTYGYGSLVELTVAGPTALCDDPRDLPALIRALLH